MLSDTLRLGAELIFGASNREISLGSNGARIETRGMPSGKFGGGRHGARELKAVLKCDFCGFQRARRERRRNKEHSTGRTANPR
jgi:hypothetical protein